MFYKAAMSSSTVQQMQLPSARSDSLRDHKSRSSNMSTTTWRKGRSIRGSLLLCVCVHPQFHFTHQLLQYDILLPRVHMIEKDSALGDGGNFIVGHNLEERWQELFASFAMVGSEIREDK